MCQDRFAVNETGVSLNLWASFKDSMPGSRLVRVGALSLISGILLATCVQAWANPFCIGLKKAREGGGGGRETETE